MIAADHPLAEAARFSDAQAEEAESPRVPIEQIGMDFEAVSYLAEQRAIRAFLAKHGRMEEMRQANAITRFSFMHFNVQEQEEIAWLTALYMDGMTIGWRGYQITEEKR